ncbi:hypothetical protein [Alkaliphilus transvaalensis]|uniref:hypothetical protein n=1 Tax=Alkaliphilus transvaalensis TaxID=114628 RepID=UPI00047EE3F8|nr:hypothetical protein [Alkaliphilus transvaalensis]
MVLSVDLTVIRGFERLREEARAMEGNLNKQYGKVLANTHTIVRNINGIENNIVQMGKSPIVQLVKQIKTEVRGINYFIIFTAAVCMVVDKNKEAVMLFIKRFLKIKIYPNNYSETELLQAMWKEVILKDRWIILNPHNVVAYVKTSVIKETKRIYIKRQQEDRIWGNLPKVIPLEGHMTGTDYAECRDPISIVVEREEYEEKIRMLREYASDKENMVIDLIVDEGYTPAEAIEELGRDWSAWISLQQKVKRKKFKNFLKNVK